MRASENDLKVVSCGPEQLQELNPDVEHLVAQPEGARFRISSVITTTGAAKALTKAKLRAIDFVTRHASGDWGETIGHLDKTAVTKKELREGSAATDDTAKLNKIAIETGRGQIFSEYRVSGKEKLWVITTPAHDSETVVLLPSEY